MAERKTIVLPGSNEMQRRLISVDDGPHTVEKFYPLLTKHAGQKKTGMGIVLMFVLAVNDYTAGMPALLTQVLYMRLPEFVKAIVDDDDVRNEAMAGMRKAGVIA